jgi:hypothetical protein
VPRRTAQRSTARLHRQARNLDRLARLGRLAPPDPFAGLLGDPAAAPTASAAASAERPQTVAAGSVRRTRDDPGRECPRTAI